MALKDNDRELTLAYASLDAACQAIKDADRRLTRAGRPLPDDRVIVEGYVRLSELRTEIGLLIGELTRG